MATFRIAVLISGGGTTLRNLIEKIAPGQLPVEIALVVSSSPTARGLQFAADAGIPSAVVERKAFADQDDFSRAIFDRCRQAQGRSGRDGRVSQAGHDSRRISPIAWSTSIRR